jgi:hypothetical protein
VSSEIEYHDVYCKQHCMSFFAGVTVTNHTQSELFAYASNVGTTAVYRS